MFRLISEPDIVVENTLTLAQPNVGLNSHNGQVVQRRIWQRRRNRHEDREGEHVDQKTHLLHMPIVWHAERSRKAPRSCGRRLGFNRFNDPQTTHR